MAYIANVFPRNSDGTIKSKLPCQTPGCDWPNWHICLDKNDPIHTQVQIIKGKRPMPERQKLAIAESQRKRHALRRDLTKKRDDEIIDYYTENNLGMSSIAKAMGISQSTVNKVLKRAEREGVVVIRPKHFTLSRPVVAV